MSSAYGSSFMSDSGGDDSGSESDSSHSDDDHVEPSRGKRARAPYAVSFSAVAVRQNMTRQADGTHTFDSAVTPHRVNTLDANQNETFAKSAKKGGSITQRPALDHATFQYALLERVHDERVHRERARGPGRRLSIDLLHGFAGAAADPSNLRIVTHDEHVAFGPSQRKADFSNAQVKAADAFIEAHMPAHPNTPGAYFSRPKYHTPLAPAAAAAAAPSMSLRPRKPALMAPVDATDSRRKNK